MSSQRALVTGGAGFLGSHLCDALLAEGWNVVVVDNLLTGRRANLDHLRNDSRFDFIDKDICEPFDPGHVDFVFHFASPASPVDYTIHGIPTLKVGSLGTFHALDVALKYGAKYLVSSTSECYGDPLEHPQKETYWGNVNSIGPRSVYDEAKRFTEAVTMAYHRYHKVDTRIVRIFNTYGPRMQLNDGRVVPNFMKQALARRRPHRLRRWKPNPQLLLCQRRSRWLHSSGEIGRTSARQHRQSERVHHSRMRTARNQRDGIKKQNCYEPLPQDDPKQRRPDITKARSDCSAGSRRFSWKPDCACPWSISSKQLPKKPPPRNSYIPLDAATLKPL